MYSKYVFGDARQLKNIPVPARSHVFSIYDYSLTPWLLDVESVASTVVGATSAWPTRLAFTGNLVSYPNGGSILGRLSCVLPL